VVRRGCKTTLFPQKGERMILATRKKRGVERFLRTDFDAPYKKGEVESGKMRGGEQ